MDNLYDLSHSVDDLNFQIDEKKLERFDLIKQIRHAWNQMTFYTRIFLEHKKSLASINRDIKELEMLMSAQENFSLSTINPQEIEKVKDAYKTFKTSRDFLAKAMGIKKSGTEPTTEEDFMNSLAKNKSSDKYDLSQSQEGKQDPTQTFFDTLSKGIDAEFLKRMNPIINKHMEDMILTSEQSLPVRKKPKKFNRSISRRPSARKKASKSKSQKSKLSQSFKKKSHKRCTSTVN